MSTGGIHKHVLDFKKSDSTLANLDLILLLVYVNFKVWLIFLIGPCLVLALKYYLKALVWFWMDFLPVKPYVKYYYRNKVKGYEKTADYIHWLTCMFNLQ